MHPVDTVLIIIGTLVQGEGVNNFWLTLPEETPEEALDTQQESR